MHEGSGSHHPAGRHRSWRIRTANWAVQTWVDLWCAENPWRDRVIEWILSAVAFFAVAAWVILHFGIARRFPGPLTNAIIIYTFICAIFLVSALVVTAWKVGQFGWQSVVSKRGRNGFRQERVQNRPVLLPTLIACGMLFASVTG